MSDPALARITRETGRGMITLRGDLASKPVVNAVKGATGLARPETRAIVIDDARALAWMSPDEALILCPHGEARDVAARLAKALKGRFHLVADVSDARAVFRIKGKGWREVLAKLTPADLSRAGFGEGEMRRTRLAQVAAAFWVSGKDEVTLLCFASVAEYVQALLENAARPGSAVGVL